MHNCLLSLPAAELGHNLPIVSLSFLTSLGSFSATGKQKEIPYLIIYSYFSLFLSLSLTHLGYETTIFFSTQAQLIFTVQFSSNLKATYGEYYSNIVPFDTLQLGIKKLLSVFFFSKRRNCWFLTFVESTKNSEY